MLSLSLSKISADVQNACTVECLNASTKKKRKGMSECKPTNLTLPISFHDLFVRFRINFQRQENICCVGLDDD